jgi:hypothetical protein
VAITLVVVRKDSRGRMATPGGRIERVGSRVVGGISPLQRALFDVLENRRPQLHAVADRDRICVLQRLLRTRQDVQSAKHDDRALCAIPRCKLIRAARKGEMNGDADDVRQWIGRRRSLQEILVPVTHFPVQGRCTRDAGQRKRRREHMFAEAGARILRIERIEQQSRMRSNSSTRADGPE